LSLSGLSLPFILTNLFVVMTFGVCILQDENEQVAVFHNDGEECQPICTHLFFPVHFCFCKMKMSGWFEDDEGKCESILGEIFIFFHLFFTE